jgi:L-ornithine N5-oxygenase
MMRDIYDCIGIGFGPANIALAVMMKEAHFRGNVLFLERSLEPNWQPGMLLEGSDIQHNPLRDFVTPRNPRSRYGFLSYLESVGRLFDFLNLDQPFPPRTEYAGYVRWVAEQFAEIVSYGEEIESIEVDRSLGADLYQIQSADGRTRLARAIAFAPGRSPLVPPVFAKVNDRRIFHASEYLHGLDAIERDAAPNSLAIVGASQSAVEIALDLLGRYPGVQLDLIWRGQGIKLKDTSPFTEHIYFPDFVDYFHAAPERLQRSLSNDLWRSNYGSADHDVISSLYLKLYEQKVTGRIRIHTHSFSEVTEIRTGATQIELSVRERNQGVLTTRRVDGVILATGYKNFGASEGRELFHPLLRDVAEQARRREDGSLHVARDFRIEGVGRHDLPPLFVNGLCESTHGFGDAGSFSLLSVRSRTIYEALSGYLLEAQQAAE